MSAVGVARQRVVAVVLSAAFSGCAGGDPTGGNDTARDDSTAVEDGRGDLVEEPDVEALCPGGCTAYDGPCMRGVCGAFGCKQVRINGLACDDGLVCTSDDRCELGMCRGETSTCAPGVACGDVYCPGEGARCQDGHCVACAMVLEDRDCESPRYPRLSCPNMPAGRRVVARLSGRVPTTGFAYYVRIGLNWADSTWGEPATGFCQVTSDDDEDGWPFACGMRFSGEYVGLEPRLRLERLTFVDGPVAAYVAVSQRYLHSDEGPVCDGIRLGGAVLSIEVEP